MSIKLFAYAFARTLGIFAVCRGMTRSRIRVLAYHGASLRDECEYNPLLFISPETFRHRVDWLQRKGFHILPLDEAADALDGTSVAPGLPTVVTFDDGWYSTVKELIPILAERDLPSTLYLHSGHFKEDWPVLPVVLGYMLWKNGQATIEVSGLGVDIDDIYHVERSFDRDLFLRRSCAWLASPPSTREIVTGRLRRLAGSLGLDADDIALQTRRFDYVSRDELIEASKRRCMVELHGHEHHYPAGDPKALAVDLSLCRDVVVGLGLPIPRHYCYPSGAFDTTAGQTLDRIGVRTATTCSPGLVRPVRDALRRHYLPRFLDGDNINMLVFEAEMSGFADLIRWVTGR